MRGKPQQLQVLHTGGAGGLIAWCSCSPSKLLCSWLDFGDDFKFSRSSDLVRVNSRSASVIICELLTGRTASVARLQSVPFACKQLALVVEKWPRECQNRLSLRWAPDGLSLFLCDAQAESGLLGPPVRQMTF